MYLYLLIFSFFSVSGDTSCRDLSGCLFCDSVFDCVVVFKFLVLLKSTFSVEAGVMTLGPKIGGNYHTLHRLAWQLWVMKIAEDPNSGHGRGRSPAFLPATWSQLRSAPGDPIRSTVLHSFAGSQFPSYALISVAVESAVESPRFPPDVAPQRPGSLGGRSPAMRSTGWQGPAWHWEWQLEHVQHSTDSTCFTCFIPRFFDMFSPEIENWNSKPLKRGTFQVTTVRSLMAE